MKNFLESHRYKQKFNVKRARGAYAEVVAHFDLKFWFSNASQVFKLDNIAINNLNSNISKVKRDWLIGLGYVALKIGSLTLAVFPEDLFASNTDES